MFSRSRIALAVTAALAALAVCVSALLGVLTAALLGGIVSGGGCGGDGGPGGGSRQIGPRTWSGEQTANAQVITSVALSRALPRRAAVLAVTTAIVESGLRNLGYGDRDSLGLFQQRPSQGWGGPAQILNPTQAAGRFYDHLLTIPGWATMASGAAEQAVQRSANPGAYAPQEPAAQDLVAKFWTGPDNPVPTTPIPTTPSLGGDAATQLVVFGRLGCPDQGGSNIPLPAPLPGGAGPSKSMPPGYQLPADPSARAALTYAIAQLGKPYVWGATGPNAFDCSGLVQAAWAAAGVPVSRTTATQVHDGTPVAGIDQVQPGDLLFIPGDAGSAAHPGHVGLAAGDGVVIDAYDSRHGVIVEPLAAWAPKLVGIRRVTPPPTTPGPNPQVLAAGPPS
jgi:cell wall-associated NlpC family hydrolase